MKLTTYALILIGILSTVGASAQRLKGTGMGKAAQDMDYGIGQNLTNMDAFTFNLQAWSSVGSNKKLRPLLSYSNEWGRYTQYKLGEFGYMGGAYYTHYLGDERFHFDAGVRAQVSTDNKRVMVNEAFVRFSFLMGQIRIGLEEYTPIETNNDLSIGSYLMSNNAHAVPRIWLGIMDYWAPLTLLSARGFNAPNAFDLRFGFSFGRMDDEGDETVTDDIMLHEKFFYVRCAQWFVKPYIGMYHSALMGGITPEGYRIPRCVGKTVFGKKGSADVYYDSEFQIEQVTPVGANQGMWDFGFDFETPWGEGKLYYQRPHADGQSRALFGKKAKDFTIGLNFLVDNFPHISEVNLEFMTTKWQGGSNMNLPVVPNQDGGYSYIYTDLLTDEDVAQIKADELRSEDMATWEAEHGTINTKDDLVNFLKDTYNEGRNFGGRVQYLDNKLYRQGWTRRGLSMGNPLMHTRRTVSTYSDGNMQLLAAFPNTRITAFNIGLKGNIIPKRLDYVLRCTTSFNYGNYNEQYMAPDSSGLSTSTRVERYLFEHSRVEVYTKIGATYNLIPGVVLNGNIAFDLGDLYKNFSFRVGGSYTFNRNHVQRFTEKQRPQSRHKFARKKVISSRGGLSTFHRGR